MDTFDVIASSYPGFRGVVYTVAATYVNEAERGLLTSSNIKERLENITEQHFMKVEEYDHTGRYQLLARIFCRDQYDSGRLPRGKSRKWHENVVQDVRAMMVAQASGKTEYHAGLGLLLKDEDGDRNEGLVDTARAFQIALAVLDDSLSKETVNTYLDSITQPVKVGSRKPGEVTPLEDRLATVMNSKHGAWSKARKTGSGYDGPSLVDESLDARHMNRWEGDNTKSYFRGIVLMDKEFLPIAYLNRDAEWGNLNDEDVALITRQKWWVNRVAKDHRWVNGERISDTTVCLNNFALVEDPSSLREWAELVTCNTHIHHGGLLDVKKTRSCKNKYVIAISKRISNKLGDFRIIVLRGRGWDSHQVFLVSDAKDLAGWLKVRLPKTFVGIHILDENARRALRAVGLHPTEAEMPKVSNDIKEYLENL